MKLLSRKNPLSGFLFFGFAALFSLQVLPGLSSNSLTNDEPSDITNGYYYLTKGDVESIQNHPPLGSALQALPLLFLNLKTQPFQGEWIDRSHAFLFDWNLDRLQAITFSSRAVSWILGLGIGALLFWRTRKHPLICSFALFFWSLDPTLLALSGLAKTDITPAFFILASVFFFEKAREEGTWKWAWWAGMGTAMAVTAKYYALVLIPFFVFSEWLGPLKMGNFPKFPSADLKSLKGRWTWGMAGFVIGLIFVYLPATLLLPDHRDPFSHFFLKFKENWVYANHPHPVYFLGKCGLENHWYYLPVAFFLKEPVPFLFLLLGGIGLAFRKKIGVPPWQWLFPLLFTLALLPTPNLGVRYLLPALPFLYLIAAQGAAWLWDRGQKGTGRWAVGILFFWQAASLAWNFPGQISYFNDFVTPERKFYLLGDSNLDWGQDLKRLASVAAERKWGKVKLAYFGAVDPGVYGLDWEPWKSKDLEGPQPGQVYVVNASFYQLAPAAYPPTRLLAEGWISRERPMGKVADSWYFFEMPGVLKAQEADPFIVSVPFLQYRGYWDGSKRKLPSP